MSKATPKTNQRRGSGFTLIELLVVIAIISMLAALVLWGTSNAGDSKVRARVKTELEQLVGAIEAFHKKHGYYPADNALPFGQAGQVNTGTNQLYYELTGTSFRDNVFTDINRQEIASAEIQAVFGVKGFANAGNDGPGQNFLTGLKPSGSALIPNTSLRGLVVPYRNAAGTFNPWHYNSTDPVNNQGKFDLWAEVYLGNKTVTIGNWKE